MPRRANEVPVTQSGSGRPRLESSPGRNGNREIRTPSLSDRELQDRVISYLSDANLRVSSTEFLDETETEGAQRFSRFLARRYYRDRLQRGFRYSTLLVSTDHAASQLPDHSYFDEILNHCVLGSLTTAREVGQFAIEHLSALRSEAWWPQILDYEFAFFLQLATSEPAPPSSALQVCVSTVLRSFSFRIPELLECLRSGNPLPPEPQGNTTLLFSRTPHGRIYVVEVDPKTEALFLEISRGEDPRNRLFGDEPALQELRHTLNSLQEIGAIAISAP